MSAPNRPDLGAEVAALSPEKRRLLEKLLDAEGLSLGRERPPYEEPADDAARTLAGIWQEVLEVERVGARDDFFQLGGDSISCLQMVARARYRGLSLDTREVFETPVLGDLAARAERVKGASSAHSSSAGDPEPFTLLAFSSERLARLRQEHPGIEDAYPLTPVQAGMLFHVLADEDPDLYRDHGLATVVGALDRAAFGRAWRRLAARHPAMRTAFLWRGVERPIQLVHAEVDTGIEDLDLRQLSSAEVEARIAERLEEDRRRPLELDRPPLFRLTLVRCPDRDGRPCHRLLWTHHHMAHDAWSLVVLVRELLALYGEEAGGEGAALPPAPAFARHVARSATFDPEASEAFWRRLYGAAEPTPPPGDRGPGRPPEHRYWIRPLRAETYRDLRLRSRRAGLTVSTALHAAWALRLASAAAPARREVVFGTVVAGRPADLPGAEAMVGLFIHTLPLRLELPPNRPFGEWLAEVQERVHELRAHEQTPLTVVQRWSGRGREPLFETVLVVQNVFTGDASGAGLALAGFELAGHTHYPLLLRATPGEALSLEGLADGARVPETEGLLSDVEWLLGEIAACDGDRPLGDLLTAVQAHLAQAGEVARGAYRRAGLERLRAAAAKAIDRDQETDKEIPS
ncbi:MAG: condensation domain-containing protein [Acidobacteriota bacterium]